MAAPHVAGAAVLIQSATDEHHSPDEITEALQETAWKPDDWDPEQDAKWHLETEHGIADSRYGHGIIDAKAAIDYLMEDQPSFQVDDADIDPDTILEGETVEATAAIENTGDAEGDFDAEFRITDGDGQTTTLDSATVTLAPDESQIVTLTGTVDEAGTYDADVSDEPAGTLTVDRPAIFELSAGSLDDTEIVAGESVAVEATVENVGDRDGTFTAELLVDGVQKDTTDVDVITGDTEPVSFTYEPTEAGEEDLAIEGDDGNGDRTGTTAGSLTVLEPAEFEVRDPTVEDAEIFEGDSTAATATIENVGEAEGTFTVELTADDGSGAEIRNETDVTLEGGESTQVQLSDTFETAGEYAIEIGDEYAGTLAVVEPDPAEFEASDVTLGENPILEGDSVSIEATIENVGDESGDHVATLYIDGEQTATEQLSLDGGESTTVSFTETFEEAGDYEITVDDAVPATLTVDRAATFEIYDPQLNESSILEGETVELAGDVENVGDREGTFEAEFRAGTQVVDEQEVTLEAGETVPVTLEATFDDAGEYDVSFSDVDGGTLTVETPADLEVTNADLHDETILEGDSVDVDAVIENHGDREGELTIELQVDGEDVGSKSVTLAGGETTTATFTEPFADAGTYEISVNGVHAGTLTVDQPATFAVTDAHLEDAEIATEESTEVTATVENTGDRDGSFEAELQVDGGITETTIVGVAAGDAETVAFYPSFENAGEYEIAVNGTNAGTLTVTEPDPAEFETTGVSLNATTILEEEVVTIEATVENVGDETGDHTATLFVDNQEMTSTTVTIDGGESTTVRFTETFDEAGEYGITVDEAPQETLTVEQPATFDLSQGALSDEEIVDGESIAVTAVVENVGDREGTFTAEHEVDGVRHAATDLSLTAGESDTVTFTYEPPEAGEYAIEVAGDDGDGDRTFTLAGSLTVLEPAEFEIRDPTVEDTEIFEGETAAATATIENVGEADGTFTAELTADDGTGAELRNETDVTLDGGEAEDVRFEATFETTGEYAIEIDGKHAGTLAVEQPATLAVTDAGLSREAILEGESIDVTADVENAGDRQGTFDVSLSIDGTAGRSQEITLEAGATETVTFTEPFTEPGTYDIAVEGTHAGTLTVEAATSEFETRDVTVTEDPILEGEPATIEATVENVGEAKGTHEATLSVDGEGMATESVELDGGEATTVTFEQAFPDAGEYDLAIDDVDGETVTVLAPTDLSVVAAETTESELPVGDELTVEATVENVGDVTGELTVDLELDGEAVADERVEVAGQAAETVVLTHEITQTGEYDVAVDGEPAGNVSVIDPADDLKVEAANLTTDEIEEGEEVGVNVTVENHGEYDATADLDLRTADETHHTESVTVPTGENANVTLTHAFDDPGEYEIHVNDAFVGNLTVTESESGGGSDGSGGDGSGGSGGGGGVGGPPPGFGSPPSDGDEETEPGPSVVADSTDGGSTVSVSDFSPSEPVAIDFEESGEGESFSHSGLELSLGDDAEDFHLDVYTPTREPHAAPEPEGREAVGYLRVERNGIENDDIEEARFEFTVRSHELPDGAEPDDVEMLRYHDSEWQELETTHEGGDTYSAVTPGFSEFAVTAGEPSGPAAASFELLETRIDKESVHAGEEVVLEATIENVGEAGGEYEAELRVDGETAETRTLEIAPGTVETVPFSIAFEDAGSYEVELGDGDETSELEVTVEPAVSTDAAGETDSDDDPGSVDGNEEAIDGDGTVGDTDETADDRDDGTPLFDLPSPLWTAGLVGMVLVAILVNLLVIGPELARVGGDVDNSRTSASTTSLSDLPEVTTDGGTTDRGKTVAGTSDADRAVQSSEFDWDGDD